MTSWRNITHLSKASHNFFSRHDDLLSQPNDTLKVFFKLPTSVLKLNILMVSYPYYRNVRADKRPQISNDFLRHRGGINHKKPGPTCHSTACFVPLYFPASVAWLSSVIVLVSGASMLYYNHWNLDQIAAIWCQYAVLQQLKPGSICKWNELGCYLRDMISDSCVADDSNLLAFRAVSTVKCTRRFPRFVVLAYAGPNSVRTVNTERFSLKLKEPPALQRRCIY